MLAVGPDGRIDRTFGTDGAAGFDLIPPAEGSFPSLRIASPGGQRLVVEGGIVMARYDLAAPTPAGAAGVRAEEYARPAPDVPAFGGASLATTADLTGDGVPDRVETGRVGNVPRVRLTDGLTGRVAADELVYEPTFTGGIFAATADLDRNGTAELIVSPDVGGGARVRVLTLTDGRFAPRDDFFAIDDPNFRGGARVAAGDVNGDGASDVVVAAGFGGGPRVAVYDGADLLRGTARPRRLVNDFFAFPGEDAVNLRNGAWVGAGDLDGDGRADLAFGGGPGGGPRVFVLSGAEVAAGRVAAAQANPIANFFVNDAATARGGAEVRVRDFDQDGTADLAAYNPAAASGEANVVVYRAGHLPGSGAPPGSGVGPEAVARAAEEFGVTLT
jgi:hypothetical protein